MLCDRCAWNGKCKSFVCGGECALERKMFGKTVSRLKEEYGLDGVADRILAERAAMYLVRIARAEAYEAAMGVSGKTATWGAYVTRLDNTFRKVLGDLAVTRSRRRQLEKEEGMLVDVDDVMRKFAKAQGGVSKRPLTARRGCRNRVLMDWEDELQVFRGVRRATVRR